MAKSRMRMVEGPRTWKDGATRKRSFNVCLMVNETEKAAVYLTAKETGLTLREILLKGVSQQFKEGTMVEVYVYTEGDKPIEVVLGRRHAVDRLTRGGFRTTPSERRAISAFLEGGLCDLGAGVHLVGERGGGEDKTADRRITRVLGPGTEV